MNLQNGAVPPLHKIQNPRRIQQMTACQWLHCLPTILPRSEQLQYNIISSVELLKLHFTNHSHIWASHWAYSLHIYTNTSIIFKTSVEDIRHYTRKLYMCGCILHPACLPTLVQDGVVPFRRQFLVQNHTHLGPNACQWTHCHCAPKCPLITPYPHHSNPIIL